MQGFSLQHTWFNRALLKAGALRMIKASENEDAFSDAIAGIVAEHDHPDMCKRFGLALGLTDQDFREEIPILEVLSHTSVIVASSLVNPSVAARRSSGLANEFIVQRYSSEFYNYLSKPPYGLSDETLEFFIVHGVVDVEHSALAAEAVARLATTDRDKQLVRDMVEKQVRLKLAKFDAIYDHYA
jgi:pyrroloquinoline quinone (PQQ) biosynthesis protein C